VEAIHRLEALFNTTLPDKLFAEAGTPMDLVRAVREAGGTARPMTQAAPKDRVEAAALAAPGMLATLVDVLGWHVACRAPR
jgi:hypothetical protein